jgi:hypothetical protein
MVDKPIIYFNISNIDEYESLPNKEEFVLKSHRLGYRSINYSLFSDLLNRKYKVDLQIMPVFESAWNCVFDRIKNFKNETDPLITSYVKILKDLSDNSDNLASNILFNKEANENILHHQDKKETKKSADEISGVILKHLLAKNNIAEVIEKLMIYLKKVNNKHLNNLIIISSQFNDIKNQITVSMIDFETVNQYNSKIINSLLKIIDEVFL